MELIGALFMLLVGGAVAVLVIGVIGMAERDERAAPQIAMPAPERDRIAASILFHLLTVGGIAPDDALREIRRRAGVAAPITSGIDVPSWAENFSRVASPAQRASLLEMAVQLVANRARPIPLRQYATLLDLSFGLGFHTDALARLREQYGFDYVDHAKDARPRDADRAGGATPMFTRERRDPKELLSVLEVTGSPSRQVIISAYRRLAAQHHPDKFFGRDETAQSEAAARFIELTRAYEALLAIYRD